MILKGTCLKIESITEYNEFCYMLRGPRPLETDEKSFYDWPIYFEPAFSVTTGKTIGIIREPIDTWSGTRLKIITAIQFRENERASKNSRIGSKKG